eukprot:m.3822 g.3822  ORF g.3822 m.3822 type:complete len:56 (-) comp2837_c0_seq1:698-865(-)
MHVQLPVDEGNDVEVVVELSFIVAEVVEELVVVEVELEAVVVMLSRDTRQKHAPE